MSEEYDRIIDQWEPERRARIREQLARIDATIESRRQARRKWEEWFAAAIAENLAAALRNEAMLRECRDSFPSSSDDDSVAIPRLDGEIEALKRHGE